MNFVFYSGRNRTLVAMAKLIIDNLLCLNGYFWNLFLQKCLLSSPLHFIWLLSISLNAFGCRGDKRVNLEKKIKKIFSKNIKCYFSYMLMALSST